MDAWLKNMGANQKKLITKTEACLEESEANRERIKAVAEHYNWASRLKITYMLTVLWGWAPDIVRGAPKGPTFTKKQRTQLECSSGIRDLGINPQLRLGSKRALNKTLKQILELQIAKLIVGSSVQLWKTSDGTLWRIHFPHRWKNRWQYACGLLRMSSLKEEAM
jgi:hypothetical protein